MALQVAEQMSDYLLRGAISNALNMPSITAEEAPKLKPFIDARREARLLRRAADRERHHRGSSSTTRATVAEMNTKALTSAALAGLLRPMLQDVNMVSAPIVAKERGIAVEETTRQAEGDYESLIPLTVDDRAPDAPRRRHRLHDGRPRIVEIKGIHMEAEFGPPMLYVTNDDKPGFIGRFASLLGDAGINIATFHLGRESQGGDAIALVEVDGIVPPEVLDEVQQLPNVTQVKPLRF